MTTQHRSRRDRVRYNAIRRRYNVIMRALFPGERRRMPHYSEIRADQTRAVVWRRHTRCECGKRRQTIRLFENSTYGRIDLKQWFGARSTAAAVLASVYDVATAYPHAR